MRLCSRSSESGLLSTELAILMPILVLVAAMGVHLAQTAQHQARTQAAADAAARAASLVGAEGAHGEASARSAAASLCEGELTIDTVWTAPSLDPIRPGRVVVALRCREAIGRFGRLLGHQHREAQARAVAAIEYWRQQT